MVNYDKENDWYIFKEKIDNQTFFMEFQVYDETEDTSYINICMGVFNKRKHAERNENEVRITGQNPIKTVMTAIRAFNELEKVAIERELWTHDRVHVSCWWVDNRRRDAYYKFLSKRGYQFGNFEGKKVIFRVYEKN